MVALTAEVKHGDSREVATATDLQQMLEDVAREAQARGMLCIIFLYAPNKDQLCLVVGGEETVLGFNHGHGNPPYYASAGDSIEEEPGLTAFIGFDHHTEYPRRWVVAMDQGRKAALEFLETGRRPTAIQWEEL